MRGHLGVRGLFGAWAAVCVIHVAAAAWQRSWPKVEEFLVADDVLDFAFAPGFRFACRARMDRLPGSDADAVTILSNGSYASEAGTFLLRVDPRDEGGCVSFFANVDGGPEPRVRARRPARLGAWMDVAGGWDGREIWLSVDGDVTRKCRPGPALPGRAPITIGSRRGGIAVADVSLFSPTSLPTAVDLPLAPGFEMTATVAFDRLPHGETALVKKDGQYMLRYDRSSKSKTGVFCFFLSLDGGWEPRCRIACPVEIGRRYGVAAGWNGTRAFLRVDGREHATVRTGRPSSRGQAPLQIQSNGVQVLNLALRSLLDMRPRIRELRTRELMPRDGRPFTLLGELANVGETMPRGMVRATAPKGVTVTPAEISFTNLTDTTVLPLEWRVDPGRQTDFRVTFAVIAEGRTRTQTECRLATMPECAPDRSAAAWRPRVSAARTYYVDARAGDDARDGTSPETAWRSFGPVRGRTLGPGERLLLRRGGVYNEELVVTAKGAADDWAEIAAYGEGPRPIIRRNRDIDDRCAYIVDPEHLVVRDIVFCNAGKGLDISCQRPGSGGVLVERCLAHHVEGLYYNAHGIPEWRDRLGAPGTGMCGGLNIGGARGRDIVLRDCEMYQCSFGFYVHGGHDVSIARVYCHDNVCHNTSPHPFLTSTTRAWLTDSVFERSGWNASAGTMGIMLGGNVGLEIVGCHFLHQPDSNCPDEGGIDFEAGGSNYRVDRCTFRNCAGAAIEVLGLRSPQSRNVHISRNRFDRNNFARKLGPSEIFVWGGSRERGIVCSSGCIEENGYVLNPGILFYTNQAVSTRADWKLAGNRGFAASDELDRAMPYNEPPVVKAGPEIWTSARTATLSGTVSDDGGPTKAPALRWEQLEGPGVAVISAPGAAETEVGLPAEGDYRFNLTADDGKLWRTARTAVHVLAHGTRLLKAWPFAVNHDAEGWTVERPGTKVEFIQRGLTFKSEPVNIVAGDYYTFALKEAARAAFVSPDRIGVPLDGQVIVTIKMQNHTPSTAMRLAWMEEGDTAWTAARSVVFKVTPDDVEDTLYRVKLPSGGGLRRLKFDLSADDRPLTGTCRVDYVHLTREM